MPRDVTGTHGTGAGMGVWELHRKTLEPGSRNPTGGNDGLVDYPRCWSGFAPLKARSA